eukprot:scaffold3821_cov134-Isochrysis_galbana.AAC.9
MEEKRKHEGTRRRGRRSRSERVFKFLKAEEVGQRSAVKDRQWIEPSKKHGAQVHSRMRSGQRH